MNKGHLKIWNEDRGFGFIKSESLKCDTFIHISSLKSMSRRPIVGDIIYFEIEKQSDGKNRAVNCRIEGVSVVTESHEYSATKNKKFSNLTTLIFVLIIGFFGYQKMSSKIDRKFPQTFTTQQTSEQLLPVSKTTYHCDGRQHCSQMNSRSEALYFIKNCPNTKMDGDRDGIPCENDSRF